MAELNAPAVAVHSSLSRWEAAVGEYHEGVRPIRCENDLDGGRAGWEFVAARNSPGEANPVGGVDERVMAGGDGLAHVEEEIGQLALDGSRREWTAVGTEAGFVEVVALDPTTKLGLGDAGQLFPQPAARAVR